MRGLAPTATKTRSAAVPSQFTELRVGHTDANGNFVNPTIPIDDGASSIGGRSLVNDRAVVPEAQEHVPAPENIQALRAALNTLGDGFVEAIDDNTLLTIAAEQARTTHGKIHGKIRQTARFTARPSLYPCWKPPGQKTASAALVGRTSTALSFPLSAMPI